MKRHHWFLLAVLLLIAGNVALYFSRNWGLITVHAKNRPLSEVIRSIEKQGGVTIKTNLDQTKPIQMHVTKVALAEAMETLSAITEARWRLTYLVAPDKGAIGGVLAGITAGQRPEGWRMHYVPAPPFGPEPDVMPDPRKDPWEVKPAKEPTLQSYLQQASRNVAASFLVPDGFNPAVTSPPGSGPISKSLPQLVSAAKGKYEEVFLLQGERRDRPEGEDRDRRRGDDGPRFAGNFGDGGRPPGGGFDREAMEERIQNEINKLPAAQRAAAQQEHDERRKFFEEMRNLTPEQRDAKMQDFMNDPANQARMEDGLNARDSRRSPQQRKDRAQSYLQRKAAVNNSAAKQ